MRCLTYSIFVSVIGFIPFNLKAQPVANSDQTSYQNAKAYFQNTINENSHLYTGKEYYKYQPGVKGVPFFMSEIALPGDIFYDGNLFKNVPLLFDAVRQVVVITQYNNAGEMQLLTEKIKFFTLNGHRFQTVAQAAGSDNRVTKELYDILYSGKISLLAKRIKKIKKGLHAEDPYSFIEEDEFYLKNGKSLFSINNKNDVTQAMADKKDVIKSYIKKNRLRFKKNIEKDLVMTAAYYSTLN